MPKIIDLKIFVPSKNFELSLKFYNELGWKTNWNHEGNLAELELSNHRFFLQNYYNKQWANNFMMYIDVEDTVEWYKHVKQLIEHGDYGSARLKPPKQEDYALVTYVWDPCGVLLHLAQS